MGVPCEHCMNETIGAVHERNRGTTAGMLPCKHCMNETIGAVHERNRGTTAGMLPW